MDIRESIEDSILVLRCQEGDAKAFAELVMRWQPRLLTHASRLIDDPSGARDVMQEAWLAAMKSLPRLAEVHAFPKWIYRIVTHKATDWVRNEQRRHRAMHGLSERARAGSGTRPRSGGRIETLKDALTRLEPVQRALITLYYVEGFSTREIGEIVGIPRGTVKSRLHNARNRIRTLMEE